MEEVKAEIVRVFGERAEEALCIAQHESGFDPKQSNGEGNTPAGSIDRGVFQLNSYWQSHIPDSEAYDARANIAHAKAIFDDWGNWNAWMARHKCGL